MRKILSVFFGLALSFSASAVTDTNRSIVSIGSQVVGASGQAYFYVSPAPSGTCLGGALYIFDLSNTISKTLYATLLTAQSAGKSLTRVDYTARVGDGACVVDLIEQ